MDIQDFIREISNYQHSQKMQVFGRGKGYNINNVGIRTRGEINKFDDHFLSYWLNEKGTYDYFFQNGFTTKAGLIYEENPINELGCATIVQGQYDYILGKYHGKDALRQNGKLIVYRDSVQDNKHNFINPREDNADSCIHLHWMFGLDKVGKASAGCNGFSSLKKHNKLFEIINKSAKIYGNNFKYSVIEKDYLNDKLIDFIDTFKFK